MDSQPSYTGQLLYLYCNRPTRLSLDDSDFCRKDENPRKLGRNQKKKIQCCFTVPLLILATFLPSTSAFLSTNPTTTSLWSHCQHGPSDSFFNLGLVPLSRFQTDLTFFMADEDYRLCINNQGKFIDGEEEFELALVEEEDLPDLSRFVVSAFGADAIRLSQDMNAFERMLISPAAELLNSYSTVVAFAEVFSGTKQRLKNRLQHINLSQPNVKGLSNKDAIEVAEKNSLVLALARPSKDAESRIQIIASIELRLQPCDAKIPFSLPWLDKLERRVASIIGLGDDSGRDLQPYLSNLCVDENFRGRRIGRALVRCVENIAQTTWGYNRIYLHVDEDNLPALTLYKSEGYRDVGHRWNPFWAGSASAIGYYVKTVRNQTK